MSASSYRQEYEVNLAGRAALGNEPRSHTTTALASDGSPLAGDVAHRIRAIEMTTPSGEPPGLKIEEVVARLADNSEDANVRQAALAKMAALEFFGSVLAPYRAGYFDALKKAATSRVAPIVSGALETLAAHKDPFAREVLLGFVNDPKSSVIPIPQVLQLLSYDDHADTVTAARSVLETAKEPDLIEEAVRLLSSDPASQDVFLRFLLDRDQTRAVRAACASALHNVNPKRFATVGKRIVGDESEYDDLRATVLSTLTHFSDYTAQRHNRAFARRIKSLTETSPSVHLKAAASRFLDRIQQEKERGHSLALPRPRQLSTTCERGRSAVPSLPHCWRRHRRFMRGGVPATPRGCAPTFSRHLRKARRPMAFFRSRWSRSTPDTTLLPSLPPRKSCVTRCGYPGALPRASSERSVASALDAYVWHDALTTARPEHADGTMLMELAVTLKAVMAQSKTERWSAAPQIRDLLESGIVAFNPRIRLLLQNALHVAESPVDASPSRTEVAAASDSCCCSGSPEPTSPATEPDLSRLPPRSAALQDQDGSIFTFSNFFAGHVSIVAFFYTRCENPDKCSLTITNLAKLQQLLGDAPLFADIRLAAVTYDPAFDTPARLKAYGRDRGVHFDERTKFVRTVDDLSPLAAFFSLSVSFGEATVNLHRVELTVLNRMLQPVIRSVRHVWQPQEVVERLATLLRE